MDPRLQDFFVNIVFWLAIGAILVTVVWFVIGKIRTASVQHEPKASEMISKFRDLHAKGQLSDAEFREVKTTLATQLRDELKDSNEKG